MLRTRIADICAALRHVPGSAGWVRAAAELCWAVPLMLVVAYAGGLVRLQAPSEPAVLLSLAAMLFVAPALGEEILFRGMMIPRASTSPEWILASTLLFVLWHPLQAVTVGPPWAAAFLDPWFLSAVAILGVSLGRIYAATRSLWPAVAAHWFVVFSWKAFLGGPF